MNERDAIQRYLNEEFSSPVRDPVWKHIYLSPSHEKIISCPVFLKLHAIKQLGPAYLVYPGATHTRFAHSLGTFHVARRIIAGLLMRSDAIPFTLEGVKAFLAAALLHDTGHYPFAHSLKNLGLEEHEKLTGELLCEDPLKSLIKDELLIEPALVAMIVDKTRKAPTEVRLLRRLLSGVLDPDKLDYLNRDAYYCGVPYGIQDVDFFLSEIVSDPQAGFALTAKGLTAVETVLVSKYLMYKTVYWHKTVRIATAMIKKGLLLALRDGVIAPHQLYHLTDTAFFTMLSAINHAPLQLVEEAFQRRLYKQVARVPFDRENPAHRALCQPVQCLKREALISEELGRRLGRKVLEHEVIIDIPEEISFEIDLPIADGSTIVEFRNTRNIFGNTEVQVLGASLRTVSLMVRRDDGLIAEAIRLYGETDPFSQ